MFFYDGFNLYHSLERARLTAPAEPVKWLDLTGLAHEHLSSIGPTETLAGVRYFTAYAEHLALTKPDRLSRHRAYVRTLTATGVQVYLGHFKPKQVWIESLGRFERIWQEKSHRRERRRPSFRPRRPRCVRRRGHRLGRC